MDLVNVLEIMANDVHYSHEVENLRQLQVQDIKFAFNENNQMVLKKQISNADFYPNFVGVV